MVKVISIQDDVYEELSRRKDNKSFSSVIRELLKVSNRNITIRDLVRSGTVLSDEEAKEMKKEILEARERSMPRDIKEL